jgi:hypothetical protein
VLERHGLFHSSFCIRAPIYTCNNTQIWTNHNSSAKFVSSLSRPSVSSMSGMIYHIQRSQRPSRWTLRRLKNGLSMVRADILDLYVHAHSLLFQSFGQACYGQSCRKQRRACTSHGRQHGHSRKNNGRLWRSDCWDGSPV